MIGMIHDLEIYTLYIYIIIYIPILNHNHHTNILYHGFGFTFRKRNLGW